MKRSEPRRADESATKCAWRALRRPSHPSGSYMRSPQGKRRFGTWYSLDGIFLRGYYRPIAWDVEYTDEFGRWWAGLSESEQESVAASVRLLEERGPMLGFPHSSGIVGSRHSHMRELRTQHDGRPLRTIYAFDPRRAAILLIGGDKTGDDRWYQVHIAVADRLYDEHLSQLRKEGLLDG